MARTRSDARLVTRSARLSLKPRIEPYWRTISKGLAVGFYKGAHGGTWKGRYFAAGKRRIETIGVADDHEDADGIPGAVLRSSPSKGAGHANPAHR